MFRGKKIKKKLTVLLITYNHEKFIERSIESILNQKTDFEIEILILDDASTDNTSNIARDYQKKHYKKIKHICRKKNIGPVENIFDGISKIKTKYFATLEGDDYWCENTKLQQQVDALDNNPESSFCGHNTNYSNHLSGINYPIFNKKKYNIKKKYHFPKKFEPRNFLKVHPSSRVYRTSCIDFENLKNKGAISWDSCSFWYFLAKGSLIYINKVMSTYNYTGSGIYSGADDTKKKMMALDNVNIINYELDYKYNNVFKKLINNPTKSIYRSIINSLIKFLSNLLKNSYLKKLKTKFLKLSFKKNNTYFLDVFDSNFEKNFENALSYSILDLYSNKYILKNKDPCATNISFLGTNIESFLLNQHNDKKTNMILTVAGSGFISPTKKLKGYTKDIFCRPINVVGLRGLMSKSRMEKILSKRLDHITLGDPGLLSSDLLQTTGIIKRYQVGIIPEKHNVNNEFLKNIKIENKLIINETALTQKFLRDLASCKFILSSSMYGLIAADSLLIPNRRIVLSDNSIEKDFKFNDYYSIFNCSSPIPINLKEKHIYLKDINKYIREYKISPIEIQLHKKKIKAMIEKL